MKKVISLTLALLLIITFGMFAIASGEEETSNQGSGEVSSETVDARLGEYEVIIDSCRLVEDFEGKDVVIVKYKYTNNSDTATAFFVAFDENVYQDGIGLNESYFVDDNANYDSGNQMKEIKKGSSIDVEVAYELNDSQTDIEVEVKELFSFSDKTITKTFSIK